MFKKTIQITLFFLFIFSVNPWAASPDGKLLYGKNCQICHGVDGKGNSKIASNFKIDLAKLDLTDKETTDKKDAEWTKVINDGLGRMRGFKEKLAKNEVSAIIKYVRSLKK